MEATWFKSDAKLPRIVEYEQFNSPGCERTDLPDSLSMSNDFTRCLGDKLPLELLTDHDHVVSDNIELEVQLDDKSFSESGEEVPTLILSSEETILFEEVRDTHPSLSLQDDREGTLLTVQSKVVNISEDKIMLLTPHELESMKVSTLESDSEKESLLSRSDLTGPPSTSSDTASEKSLTPITVSHGNDILYMCPIEECSRGFSKLCLAKSHVVTHIGARQFKVNYRSFSPI